MSGRAVAACSALALLIASAASAAAPAVQFRVYAQTGIRLTDIVWTGERFLYLENTKNTVWAADRTGRRAGVFASMPKQTEETRCRLPAGSHGFAAGDLYCHSPDNTIYRIDPSGKVTTFAKLPEQAISDGALAFDTVGRFGFALLAATGRSGRSNSAPGAVYAISPAGVVRRVGRYTATGGADEIVVAPAGFGSGAGQAVLTIDAGKTGSLLMMSPRGAVRRIAQLPDGPNPIVAVPRGSGGASPGVAPGLYVTDTLSKNVFFAPASALARYAGDLVVGSELRALFWAVRPRGSGFQAVRIPAVLPGSKFNLEGAVYVI
ncbi:MAG: hypothetical protein HOQ28_20805 [Thermoleophilia bacterium]|nr:hypothetical protein [Thermoleophilia bacterium]